MNRLRVLTLNIWNRGGPWERRLPLIRAGIERLSPDLIGLQEVIWEGGRSQADEIGEGLGYRAAFGVAHDLGNGRLFGNAVLSRWPVRRSLVVPLPSGGTTENRSALFAELDSPHGLVPFFVTHLSWKFNEGVVREAQVAALAEVVDRETPAEGFSPILVGDFNAQPESSEVRFVKGLQSLGGKSFYMADCFEQAGTGPGITFDAARNPFAAVTHEYPRRIDYIFVRGVDRSARGRPLAASVVLEEVVDGVAASDHYGVMADISV